MPHLKSAEPHLGSTMPAMRLSLLVIDPDTISLCADQPGTSRVQEFELRQDKSGASSPTWQLSRADISIGHSKVFAPANLRATRENHAYRELVNGWMEKGYTLRYSGGMVPDVHHILAKACAFRPGSCGEECLSVARGLHAQQALITLICWASYTVCLLQIRPHLCLIRFCRLPANQDKRCLPH